MGNLGLILADTQSTAINLDMSPVQKPVQVVLLLILVALHTPQHHVTNHNIISVGTYGATYDGKVSVIKLMQSVALIIPILSHR